MSATSCCARYPTSSLHAACWVKEAGNAMFEPEKPLLNWYAGTCRGHDFNCGGRPFRMNVVAHNGRYQALARRTSMLGKSAGTCAVQEAPTIDTRLIQINEYGLLQAESCAERQHLTKYHGHVLSAHLQAPAIHSRCECLVYWGCVKAPPP